LISNKFEKEIVFESSVLAWNRIRIRIRIRMDLKCYIRILIESIRIHNPGGEAEFTLRKRGVDASQL
jgi:hypothetical protein